MPRPIYEIAKDIYADWSNIGKGISPYAKPYLEAMFSLNHPSDNYVLDSGDSVIRYFLANAQTYRGEKAKQYKSELKKQLTY